LADIIKKEPLIRIAKRAERSNKQKLIIRLLSVLLAICAGGIFILILGKDPFSYYAKMVKGAFIGNLCTFAGIMLCALIVPVGNFVSAASEEGVKAALSTGAGLGYLAAALAVGLSCVGSGIAVAAGAPAAIGATSEDPKNFVKALIFVVLGEGIALYGLLIAILIISNVGTALGI